jgi:beta-lactamase regulating signal transducer with metallopeptidase domain
MPILMSWYPGDRAIELFVVIAATVTIVSSAGWVASWKLAAKPAGRHAVALSALISSLALPALACMSAVSGMTLLSLEILTQDAPAPTETNVASAEPFPRATGRLPLSLSPIPDGALEHPVRANPDSPTNRSLPIAPVAAPTPANSVCTPAATEFAQPPDLGGLRVAVRAAATALILVWAGGVALLLATLVQSGLSLARLRRSARPVLTESYRLLLEEAACRVGARVHPRLLDSNQASTPIAIGFGQPAVILPECLIGAISENELWDVLLHEIAHLKRHDHWIVLLQELARALYWPVVPVHGLNRELRRAREDLCDNIVLQSRDPISYGETLLHVARLSLDPRPTRIALGILEWRGELERRIAALLDRSRNTRTSSSRRVVCFTTIAFLAGGMAASATRLVARGNAAEAPAANAVTPLTARVDAKSASSVAPQRPAPAATEITTVSDLEDPKLAGTFAGQVLGPDAKPLPGAKIFIVPDDGKIGAIGPVRAVTDADGRFTFEAPDMTFRNLDGLPARRQGLLFATHEGYAPDWMTTWGHHRDAWRMPGRPSKETEHTLRLARNDVTIRGTLLDPEGGRLAGARVRLAGLMVPKKFDLNAHLEDVSRLTTESRVSFEGAKGYERSLTRHKLLPGATVETVTDAAGRFSMPGLGRDRLAVLEVSAPKVIDATLTVMTRLGRDVETRLDRNGKPTEMIYGAGFILQLKPGRTVTGIVRDRETHQGIPGMWVGPHGASLNGLNDGEHPTATDENGRFTITGLDPAVANQEVTAVPQPGTLYPITSSPIDEKSEVLLEPARGIPFRLKLTDEQGRPARAEVTYHVVLPSAHIPESRNVGYNGAINYAARKPDGTYVSFVLPGPGAVLVRTPDDPDYRPAHVDPKPFFAPGKTNWTKQDLISTYGNHDTLSIHPGWWLDQHEYAAIILVNPSEGSGPLELSASVVRDKPRRVSLVDPEGKPVVGAESEGLTFFPWDNEPELRSATFSITKLHPDRLRRVTFVKADRKLVGFLGARGDGDTAYTVRMQPWATLTGRILDEAGKPLFATDPNQQEMPAYLHMGNWRGTVPESNPAVGEHAGCPTDKEGRFRLEQLVPGLRYSAQIYRDSGMFAGMAFENLVLRPGEVRDLGDIRSKPPVDVRGK